MWLISKLKNKKNTKDDRMHTRLKKLREENNYSQKQIADYLEIDQSYISKIERK